MKKISIRLLLIALICLIGVMIVPARSYAVLQANGGTVATKTLDSWITSIRGMESTGGCLGLTEDYNPYGLLATTDSNNLDCHMEKNTEYGALVILSASAYGNPGNINSGNTTTGNITGAKMNINKEWVAAGRGLTSTTYAKNANARYINNDYNITSHLGDAMNIYNWHSGTAMTRGADTARVGVVRAISGSVFSYSQEAWNNGQAGVVGDAFINRSWATRAVIVVGHSF